MAWKVRSLLMPLRPIAPSSTGSPCCRPAHQVNNTLAWVYLMERDNICWELGGV